ncbi:MAG TPA: hypothetical protein VK659_15195, partial [Asanoa sp.]|nr:hypothetical protein [Asanoa sp.]
MGHVAKHSAGAGSNPDRSEPASKPGEPAETPAEPAAVRPGDRPADPAESVVVEPMDAPAAPPERPDRSRPDGAPRSRPDGAPPARPERLAAAETPVVRPNMPDRTDRRWWRLGRADDEQRPVSHAAGAKSRPKPDERRPTDRDPSPGVAADPPDDQPRRSGPGAGSGGTGWERGPDAEGGLGAEPDASAWSRPGSRAAGSAHSAGSRGPAAPTAGAARSHGATPDRSSSAEASRGNGDRPSRSDRSDSAKGGLETFRGDSHREQSSRARSDSAAERLDALFGDRSGGPTSGSLDALREDQTGGDRSGAGSSPSHWDLPRSDGTGSGWPRGGAIGPEPAASWDRAGSHDARSTEAASGRSGALPNGAGSMSGSDILGLDASLSDTTEHVLVASGPVGLTATEPDGGPDADETRSELRPTAPLGTPTYEGVSSDDTAKLPRIGHAIQAERIWTTRPDPETTETEKAKNGKNGKNGKHGKKIDVTSLTDVGIKLLPEIEPGAPDGPVTNARWAALVRAISRRLTWTLPAAGVIAAAASIGAMVRGGPAHYLTGAEPFRLFAWVTSVWLGVVA